MSNQDLRQKWRNYWEECDRLQRKYEKWYDKECFRITAEWRKKPILYPRVKLPVYPSPWAETPPFPEELRGLT